MSERHNARWALRMPAWMVPGLLLAVIVFADDYPKPSGFVNDFANQLPVSTVQALEKRLRDYERATGNEIAVAVVPSLNGMLVDDYARELFHRWGVGKRALNNGVLFVWAPKERRIRIEVGLGLQAALTDAAAGLIVSRVRDLFRGRRYDAGVNAAVDGIIQALGTVRAGGTLVPNERNFEERNSPEGLARQRQEEERQRQEQERRQQEEDTAQAVEESRQREWTLGCIGVLAALGVVLYMMYRRRRAARWLAELPRELANADQVCAAAGRKKAEAQAVLTDLRKEAPGEVCQRFDEALGSVADELERQRSQLQRLQSAPRMKYGELKAAHDALRQWQARMAITATSFEEVAGTSETFRAQREEARRIDPAPEAGADGVGARAGVVRRRAAVGGGRDIQSGVAGEPEGTGELAVGLRSADGCFGVLGAD
jgi:uncharacterized membrane protein YgcG